MKNTKKILAVLLVVMTMVALAGCSSVKKEETITGGWQTAEDGAITEELQALFEKAMEGHVGVVYKPVELLETQVVAGTNYRFLCETAAVTPGAETGQAIVTVYEDLNGNAEILEIEELEAEGTQIPNPFVTYETMEEAEKAAGFEFDVPQTAEGLSIKEISCVSNEMIQVVYGDEYSIFVRKAKGTDDISGDYTVYDKVEDVSVGGVTVTERADEQGIYSAIWSSGGYSYAIISSDALTREAVEGLVTEIK